MTEQELVKTLKLAMLNLELDAASKDALLSAIFSNFEHFEVMSATPEGDSTSIFLTSHKTKHFRKNNFINAYRNGSMNIEDLVFVLF